MTKEQLAKLGITVETDTVEGDELDALLSKHISGLNDEIKKGKNLISERNTEIKSLKDKANEKLTEDEKTQLFYKELEETNKSLQREINLSKKVAEYVELGYSKDLATKVAQAELDGKSTTEYHKQFIEATEQRVKAEILKQTPNVKSGGNFDTVTREDYKKMTYSQKMKLREENPELFEQVSKDTAD